MNLNNSKMKKLFDAKKQMPIIKKDANNPFFKSGYATLSNIIEVTEPVLAKHGLFITHSMQDGRLITALWDSELTGNQPLIASDFLLPVNNDIQKIGSAITYAKRYNITALLNLNIEDDDDGNSAKPTTPKATETISKECKAYMEKINRAEDKTVLKAIGAELAKDTKLTANDKDFLRNLYSEKDAKLK